MFHESLVKMLEVCDDRIARVCARWPSDSPRLLIFTFHSLFSSSQEVASGSLDPQQAITTEMFRQFVGDFQTNGYRFISPQEIVGGLATTAKYALITFDDGYYNNMRALPVLQEFKIPAAFCISTGHIEAGKAFWWDVLYREARIRGWSSGRTDQMRSQLKRMRTDEAEQRLRAEFGRASLQPVGDLDRPMRPAELGKLAAHPLVHLENHTADHAILTNYSPVAIKEQMVRAQEFISRLTGKNPVLIAYPNGNLSREVVRIAREAGLRLGVTVQAGRNRIADTHRFPGSMALKRYTLWSHRLESQCRIARSRFSLRTAWSSLHTKSKVAFA